MNCAANDFNLSPEEICDDQFAPERGTAIVVEGETWWTLDQFVTTHCQHVGHSISRHQRLLHRLQTQSGNHAVQKLTANNGISLDCVTRSTALRYLAERKNEAAIRNQRKRGHVPTYIQVFKEMKSLRAEEARQRSIPKP